MDVVVAIDCSTTASKAIAFSFDGSVRAVGRCPIQLDSPRVGWYEQDAREWWTATADALRQVTETLHELGDEPVALGITHQRESFVCLGADDAPTRPAILWLDARSGEQVRSIGTEEVHRLSGKPPSTTPSFYKLAWLAEHEPARLADAARISDVHAFLALHLAGRFVTSTASADSTGLVDTATGAWSARLLELASVREAQLPELVAPGSLIGGLDARASETTGLPEGLPVIAGAGDGQCGGLGAGVTETGEAYLSLGTSIVLGARADHPSASLAYRILSNPSGDGNTLEAFVASGAISVSWFRKAFPGLASSGEENAYELALDRSADRMRTLMFVPHLSGSSTPYWDERGRGAFVGIDDGHTEDEFYRAVLEGLAFEIRLLCVGLESAGSPIDEVTVMGGGTVSDGWMQIIADVLGRPLRIPTTPEATALGAAILAAAHVRFSGDASAAAEQMSHTARTVTPSPERARRYAELYSVYTEITPALSTFHRRAAALGGGR